MCVGEVGRMRVREEMNIYCASIYLYYMSDILMLFSLKYTRFNAVFLMYDTHEGTDTQRSQSCPQSHG